MMSNTTEIDDTRCVPAGAGRAFTLGGVDVVCACLSTLERVNINAGCEARPHAWCVSEQNSRSFDLLTPY